jgi:hypothetical protein
VTSRFGLCSVDPRAPQGAAEAQSRWTAAAREDFVRGACGAVVLLIMAAFGAEAQEPQQCAPYLGEPTPGSSPVVFAPGVVSTDSAWEFSITFSPGGMEFYFTRRRGSGEHPKHHDGRNTILVSRCLEGSWSAPEVAGFSGEFPDHEPYITLDGTKLFWGSNRPFPDGRTGYAIWYAARNDSGWGDPQLAGIEGMYITATDRGDLYTSGIDKYRFEAGTYSGPIAVGVRGSHPYIAPDESFMLFDRERRVDGEILSFMYLTVRNSDGTWTEPVELQGDLNRGICPSITPDGKYFFYSSGGSLYWVNTAVLQRYKRQ